MALEEKLEYQMTQEGYDQLVEELEHYKKVKRPEVIEKIKVVLGTYLRTQSTMQQKMNKGLSNKES